MDTLDATTQEKHQVLRGGIVDLFQETSIRDTSIMDEPVHTSLQVTLT